MLDISLQVLLSLHSTICVGIASWDRLFNLFPSFFVASQCIINETSASRIFQGDCFDKDIWADGTKTTEIVGAETSLSSIYVQNDALVVIEAGIVNVGSLQNFGTIRVYQPLTLRVAGEAWIEAGGVVVLYDTMIVEADSFMLQPHSQIFWEHSSTFHAPTDLYPGCKRYGGHNGGMGGPILAKTLDSFYDDSIVHYYMTNLHYGSLMEGLPGCSGASWHNGAHSPTRGGASAGSLKIDAGYLNLSGEIRMDGESAPSEVLTDIFGAGGGAGGTIFLVAQRQFDIGATAIVTANGGHGGYCPDAPNDGYGGGGGRIFFEAPSSGGSAICTSAFGTRVFAYGGKGPREPAWRYSGGAGYFICTIRRHAQTPEYFFYAGNHPTYQYPDHSDIYVPIPTLLVMQLHEFLWNMRFEFSNVHALAVWQKNVNEYRYFSPWKLVNLTPNVPVRFLFPASVELCLESRDESEPPKCIMPVNPTPSVAIVEGIYYIQRAFSFGPVIMPKNMEIRGPKTVLGIRNHDSGSLPTQLLINGSTFVLVDRSECAVDMNEYPVFMPGNTMIRVNMGGTFKLGTRYLKVVELIIQEGTFLISHDLPDTVLEIERFVCGAGCIVRAVVGDFQCATDSVPSIHPDQVLAGGSHAGCSAKGGCRNPGSPLYVPPIKTHFVDTRSMRRFNRPVTVQQSINDRYRSPGGLAVSLFVGVFEHHGLISVKGGSTHPDHVLAGVETGRGAGGTIRIIVGTLAHLGSGTIDASGGDDDVLWPSTNYEGASGGYIVYFEKNPTFAQSYNFVNYGSQSVVNGVRVPNRFGAPGITFIRCMHNMYPSADDGMILVETHPAVTEVNPCLECAPIAMSGPQHSLQSFINFSKVDIVVSEFGAVIIPDDLAHNSRICLNGATANYNAISWGNRRRQLGSLDSSESLEKLELPGSTGPLYNVSDATSSRSRGLSSACDYCYMYDEHIWYGFHQKESNPTYFELYTSNHFSELNYFGDYTLNGHVVTCSTVPGGGTPPDPCPTHGDVLIGSGVTCEYAAQFYSFDELHIEGRAIFSHNFEAGTLIVRFGSTLELKNLQLEVGYLQVDDAALVTSGNVRIETTAGMWMMSAAVTGTGVLRIFGDGDYGMEGSTVRMTTSVFEDHRGHYPYNDSPGTHRGPGINGGIYGGCLETWCSYHNNGLLIRPYGWAYEPSATGSPGLGPGAAKSDAGGFFSMATISGSMSLDNTIINVDAPPIGHSTWCGGSGGAIFLRAKHVTIHSSVLTANGADGNAPAVLHCPGGGGRIGIIATTTYNLSSVNWIARGGINSNNNSQGPTGSIFAMHINNVWLTATTYGEAYVTIKKNSNFISTSPANYLFEQEVTPTQPVCDTPIKVQLDKSAFVAKRALSGHCVSLQYNSGGSADSIRTRLQDFRVDVVNTGLHDLLRKPARQQAYDFFRTQQTQAENAKAFVDTDKAAIQTLVGQCLAQSSGCEPEECEEVVITPYVPVQNFPPGSNLNVRIRGVPRKQGMSPKHGAFLQYVPAFFRSSYLLSKADFELLTAGAVKNSTHCTATFKVPATVNGQLCSDHIILYS